MKKIKIYLLASVMILISSCGGDGGTTTGNPIMVKMEFAAFNNSIAKMISNWFIPEAHASLSSLKMCLKRVRFKVLDSSAGNDIELELGEIEIKPEGTPLGNIEIANTTYRRIEFDLANDCDGTTKPSVTINNSNGTFTTNDGLTIKFEGEFTPSAGDLTLFIQNIVDQVKNYQISDGEIKAQLEAVSGTY